MRGFKGPDQPSPSSFGDVLNASYLYLEVGEVTRNRSLLLGVAMGLFGALAVMTARYVAVVLAG